MRPKATVKQYAGEGKACDLLAAYYDVCTSMRLAPDENISHALSRLSVQGASSGSHDEGKVFPCLDLSGHSFPPCQMEALSRVLATDSSVREVALADCLLPEQSLESLCDALCSNTALTSLNLKGNNLKGLNAELLGKLLRNNKHIQRLSLEWNSLGVLEDSFSVLCEGLGSNTSVEFLDLKNNQISQVGAGELATAIRRNCSFKYLDLRWNTIGGSGGQAILSSLSSNKRLLHLEMAGNNIPNDTLQAITSIVRNNVDKKESEAEFQARSQFLHGELERNKLSHSVQVSDLLHKLDDQQDLFTQSAKQTTEKVRRLQEALDDRKMAFQALNEKLSKTERALKYSESKVEQYVMMLEENKKLRVNMEISHKQDVELLQQEKHECEQKLQEEIKCILSKYEMKCDDFSKCDARCQDLRTAVIKSEEEMCNVRADYTKKLGELHQALELEQEKCVDFRKQVEDEKRRELEKVRRESDDRATVHRQEVSRQVTVIEDLEQQILDYKKLVKSERNHFEEQISEAKQKVKSDFEFKLQSITEKLKLIEANRNELRESYETCLVAREHLESQNNRNSLELESCKNQVQLLHQELNQKQSEMVQSISQLKCQLSEKDAKIESGNIVRQEVEQQLLNLQQKTASDRKTHEEQLRNMEHELSMAKQQVARLHDIMNSMREAECNRAAKLKNFVCNFVSQAGSIVHVDGDADKHQTSKDFD